MYMELSKDADFYCPACGTQMNSLKAATPILAVVRCVLCAQTWEVSISDAGLPVVTAVPYGSAG
jgi:transcription elongation factor Elf1